MPSFAAGPIRAITFDLYGTLLDLEATFAPAFDGFLRRRGSNLDAAELVRTWEWAYLHEGMVDTFVGGPRTSFEKLRRTTLSQVLSRCGIAHGRDDIEDLLTHRASPTLFPDVEESLGLQEGAIHAVGAVQRRPERAGTNRIEPLHTGTPDHLRGAGGLLQAGPEGLPSRRRTA